MLKEFRDFLLRGNIVELAVAFVMGLAFAAVVNSLVNNLVMPIVAMIIGKPDFSDLTFTINDAVFHYGAFITDVIQFVAIAAAVVTNVISAVRKAPYRNTASLIVNVRSLKSGLPMIIATIGMIRSSTNDVTSAANARPMTKATASSTRLPRIRKSLNSLSIRIPPVS